jgi:phosphate transport system permease protein
MTSTATWRKLLSSLFVAFCALAVILALVPLAFILFFVVSQGVQALNLAFFTHMPAPVGEAGGGMMNSDRRHADPERPGGADGGPDRRHQRHLHVGVRRQPVRGGGRFAADTLNGVPSIVIGLFAYVGRGAAVQAVQRAGRRASRSAS